jgi:hypothetical protein
MPASPTLIAAPYTPPSVKIGQRIHCLFRDTLCKVSSLSDAPIIWPRVQPIGQRGGSGLLVDKELVRAIKTESAEALKHWFGASTCVVWRWRKWQKIDRLGTKGSAKLHEQICKKGADAVRGKQFSDERCDAQAERSKKLGLRPPNRWTEENGAWTKDELTILGTERDAEIAEFIGRTTIAVRCKRVSLGIQAFSGFIGGGLAWTAEEITLLGTDDDEVVAAKIGRTVNAVSQRRALMGIAVYRDWRRGPGVKREWLG